MHLLFLIIVCPAQALITAVSGFLCLEIKTTCGVDLICHMEGCLHLFHLIVNTCHFSSML